MASCISSSPADQRDAPSAASPPPLSPPWALEWQHSSIDRSSRTEFFRLIGPQPTSTDPRARGTLDLLSCTVASHNGSTDMVIKAHIANVMQTTRIAAHASGTVAETRRQMLAKILRQVADENADSIGRER